MNYLYIAFALVVVLAWLIFTCVTGARRMRALRARRDKEWKKEYGFCRHCGSKCLRTVVHNGYDYETGKERTYTSDDCIEDCYCVVLD